MLLKTTSINLKLRPKKKTISIKMEKKIKVLVIGEVGYYSLFAEGYLHFYSDQKLKIKTTAFDKLKIPKKITKILEEDMIPSKENFTPIKDASKLVVDYVLYIGAIPADFSMKTKASKIHTIQVKKDLSLPDKRDFIKKKVLKFLDKQGLYGT